MYMSSDEASCSDCKIELIEKRWTQLLLKWMNKCIYQSSRKVKKLNPQSLADIMAKYNKDVCQNDIDRAMLCTDDVEPFINYKYPILRLHYLSEESDIPKRLYITTSMILYHCCMSSQTGAVDGDICKELTKYEQELIFKFCENLSDMEATVHNIEQAIKCAYDSVEVIEDIESSIDQIDSISSDTEAQGSSEPTSKASVMSLDSDATIIPEAASLRMQTMRFNSITVLPSVMADTSNYSDMMSESDDEMMEKDIYVDSDDINVYAVENTKVTDKPKQKMIKKETLRETLKKKLFIEEKLKKIPKISKKNTQQDNTVIKHAESKHKVFNGRPTEKKENDTIKHDINKDNNVENVSDVLKNSSDSSLKKTRCLSECACSRCSASGPCCGDPGSTMGVCKSAEDGKKKKFWQDLPARLQALSKKQKLLILAMTVLFLIILIVVCSVVPYSSELKNVRRRFKVVKFAEQDIRPTEGHIWHCKHGLCQKAYQPSDDTFASYSRCSLICMGPQLWPYPVGYTFYSKKIVALSTSKLEYKFQSIPSETVHQYVAEAFKHFIGDLARLEKSNDRKNKTIDLPVKKMSIQIDVESDADPRLRLNTEEAYDLKIKLVDKKVVINVSASSFCGVRHGLETLSQMILLDQTTGKLITLTNAVVKDAPAYKYRGLMIDTGRNYIPVPDLLRTVDAMATVKLNTFHWRISDVTSFPLLLPTLPQLFEYGAYDRSMVYTKEDVKAVVNRAAFKGIRVLIEVAAPGPVGRPWSWSSDVSCPAKNDNYTCNNVLCLRMNMQDSIFDVLRTIYTEIIEMTKVDDIIHLSNGVFSLTNCYSLIEDRDGFLDKVLAVLQQANKGFMPKLPVIWYTQLLTKDYEAKTWERLGVQLNEINQDTEDNYLSKFKVIHSGKWDLSCEMKKYRCIKYRTWQEMYAWKSWRNIEVFTIEGGEAVLWTDLVNSGNLDYHLWPRAAAVAERLWSDTIVNVTSTGPVYVRLDSQRWRMLFHGVNVQPVWPVWCSFNPGVCLEKLNSQRK